METTIIDITGRIDNADAAEWLGLEVPEGENFEQWAEKQSGVAVCTAITPAACGMPYSEPDATWDSDWECAGIFGTLCEATINAIVWKDYQPDTGDWQNIFYPTAGGRDDGVELLAAEMAKRDDLGVDWMAQILNNIDNTYFYFKEEKYAEQIAELLEGYGLGEFRRKWVAVEE